MPFINAYDDDPDPEAVPGAYPATADPMTSQYRVYESEDYPADLYGGYGIEDALGSIVYDAECFDKTAAVLACQIMNELDCDTWGELRAEMERRGWIDPLKETN